MPSPMVFIQQGFLLHLRSVHCCGQSRASKIDLDNAFHRDGKSLSYHHRAPHQFFSEWVIRRWGINHLDEMVRHDLAGFGRPEGREAIEHLSLAGDASGKDMIEGGDTVRGYHKKPVTKS